MGANDFAPLHVATALDREIWRRKTVAAVAFGVECRGVAVMLESDWDRNAAAINRWMGTCHPILDEFYLTKFSGLTTRWIHEHPDLVGIERQFDRYCKIMSGHFDFNDPRWQGKVMTKR